MAQDYSGVYYIANKIWNGDHNNSTYWYNNLPPEQRWYMVPAKDPQQPKYEDAYYSGDGYATYGESEKPFLTTYQTNRDNNSIWIVKKTGNKYYIIHALTGKYVKYEPPFSDTKRSAMHLEAWTDSNNDPGNVFKYTVTTKTEDNISGYNIRPTQSNGTNVNGYFNPAGDNWDAYYGLLHSGSGLWCRGMVGWYNSTGGGSLWPWEDAKNALTPNIDDVNILNRVTITPAYVPVNCQLVYTIDEELTATNGTPYTGEIPVTGTMTIRAAVVGYGMVLSNIVSKTVSPFVLDAPSFAVNCQNQLAMRCDNLSDARIYYTMTTDGSEPPTPTTGSTQYQTPITLNDGDRVKARAYTLSGDNPSEVSQTTFHPAYSVTPTIAFTAANTVSISYPRTATIYYNITEDGSEPDTPSTIEYTGTGTANTTLNVTIDPTKQIRISAIAKEGSLEPSCDPATGWKLPQPELTTSCDDATLTITSSFPVYYTTAPGLGTPTTESTPYTEPITGLTAGDRLNILAIDSQNHTSYLIEYTHAITHTAPPTIEMTSSTIITITGPSGSTIYYTIDGDDPVIGEPSVVFGPSPVDITYNGNVMDIRALAKTATLEPSCVTRLLTIGTPTITISADDCTEPSPRGNVVNIPLPGDGGTIWYAITAGANSTAPGINVLPNPYSQYTGPVAIDDLDGANTDYTVHAYAKSSDGSFNSPVASTSHQMKTGGKPELTEPSGSNPVVVISGGVFGDVAVCTVGSNTTNVVIASDGTAEYTIPSGVSGTLTVSFKHGAWLTSCEATYVIPAVPATPTWSQTCDNLLSLSTTSPMAVIHYERGVDGINPAQEPTLSSPTYTEGCLYNIAPGTRVRAKAFESFLSSSELNFVYQPEHAEVPQFFVNGTTVTMTSASGSTIYYTMSVGTQAGVVPDDPLDPNAPGVTPNEYTAPIAIAQGNIITVFKAIAIPTDPEQGSSCVVRVVTREGYSINVPSDLNKLNVHPSSYFFVLNDINAGNYPTTTVNEFTGVLDGNYYTISNLGKPLFNTINGGNEHNAAVLNLMLKNVTISTTGNAGAIANTAKGYTRIYNCGILPDEANGTTTSSISGGTNGKVGSLVGELDGTARVINCFSYANINDGKYRGGIVGYNRGTSVQGDITTMIMNCMFYGEIATGGYSTAPVYGGTKISNVGDTGLNNYNYFRFNSPYVSREASLVYNCALGAQDRYLKRFEFYRLILNSNSELAMWYVSGSVENAANEMGRWVLDKSVAPYPILKEPGQYYPSIINPDAAHAIPIDPDNEHRNEGRKLDELTVKITASTGWTNKPEGAGLVDASYATTGFTLNVIDKDEANYNFNYKKVQLPYYNEVGTNNYTGNKVVTGWKITGFDHVGTGHFTTTNYDYPNYNYVDRTCTEKDLYSHNGRVFNQGAYYEVPDGVTEITIEPYWANCVYLSDQSYDVTYTLGSNSDINVTPTATQVVFSASASPTRPDEIDGGQTVYHSIEDALAHLGSVAGQTVYDYAVVLVGNYHHYFNNIPITGKPDENGTYTKDLKPLTIMSADFDHDNEPDNCFFYQHYDRHQVAPLRFDFINMPGIGMAHKQDGGKSDPQPGIFRPRDWFEITNTVLISFGQFEYGDGTGNGNANRPIILQGGLYEQFVSNSDAVAVYSYMLLGGNAWFKVFQNGCHTKNQAKKTPKHPISVAGGDFEKFYLSGLNKPTQSQDSENAECYIDGGRFGEVAGAGMQEIKGNVTWLINAADITSFFGGGINDANPITGHVSTTIKNSWVTEFYGGPKFGNMQSNKEVTTVADNCHFVKFYGAGHGGSSFNRIGVEDYTYNSSVNFTGWNDWVNTFYERSYQTSQLTNIPHANTPVGSEPVNGISTSYEYEYFFYSGGHIQKKVARFYINIATLSLASTKNVTSTLTGCTIGDFYGGGRLGEVNGDVNSTLTDCTVTGDVFGSGYSGAAPTVDVTPRENSLGNVGFEVKPDYNNTANVFNDEQVAVPTPVPYTWNDDPINFDLANNNYFATVNGQNLIYTTQPLNNLGTVSGNATLTINGNSVVMGDVYGGGALSSSNTEGGKCTVNINGGTYGVVENNVVSGGNIYGGGKGNASTPVSEGNVEVNIGNASQSTNNVVINGSVYGCNNVKGSPKDNVTVHIYKTKHNSSNTAPNLSGSHAIKNVFGGGNQAHYQPTSADKKATVHVHNCDNTIEYIYGGGNAANVGTETTNSETNIIIDGGRHKWVFGGGNGAGDGNPGAHIYGNTNVIFHAGHITYLFGGSNEKGRISGEKFMSLLNDGACTVPENRIVELYGGNNLAPIESGGVSLTMNCSDDPCPIDYLFGGSRMANITGDVTLTVYGGLYNYVFGGNNLYGEIDGNVTLNLYGGIINNAAFGGNKGGLDEQGVFYNGGSITGNITVNVEDAEDPDCPLVVHDVFGAGDLAIYTAPTGVDFNPVVNIKHIRDGQTVTGSVFGGGNGDPDDESQEPGMVTGNPKVIVGDLTEGNEDYRAAISGNVYGGGNAAKVVGNTTVLMQKANSTVGGALYGGGNQAGVSGTATVTMTLGQVATGIYGGCNTSGTVNGAINVYVNGGTVGSSTTHADGVYGGGFGADTGTGDDVTVTIGNSDGTPEIYGDVYGGSAKGDVNSSTATTPNTTKVWLKKGTITGDIYGGGYGLDDEEALVYGNVVVLVSGGTVNSYTSGTTTLGGRVFGCNNVNGTPKGMVDVTIDATNPSTGTGNEKVYALQGVYGGGNLAAYDPTTPYENGETVYPKVTVNGCTSSVKDVYGGGNAAPVPNSKVVINGGDIKRVFAGGNGESGTPAHIGWKNTDPAPTSDAYGTGQASAEINGGTILQVFGGSNANGVIRVSSAVNVDKSTATGACNMVIGEVYGGGNEADGNAGTITIGCTGTLTDDHSTHPENIGVSLEGIGYVYGGANQADINNDITLDINSGIVGNVFGGNNTSGAISGTITVNIEKDESNTATCPDDWYVGDVYGGGNHADYDGTPDVNIINGLVSGSVYGGGNDITDHTKGVKSSDVEMTGGTVLGGVYGGCNLNGTVTENSEVKIYGGTIGSQTNLEAGTVASVFGGGLGANTKVNRNVTVTIDKTGTDAPVIYGDVYGGSALGEVNSETSTTSPYTTTVDILEGTLKTKRTSQMINGQTMYFYTGGNVFGGGLGESDDDDKGKVYGKVTVNIGQGNPHATEPFIHQVADLSGNATIEGNVYGCNNSGGSPQDDVTVNIFQTAHTDGANGTPNNTLSGDAFAIANVFGGGNEANFSPATDKKTYVNIYTCNNTIGRLFGGGNAAATPEVVTHIQGGRFSQVFGGGNGERGEQYGANVNGDVTLNIHGGTIGEYYGGSNQNGTISGTIHTNVLNDGPCESVTIDDFFCGGNFVDIFGDLVTTIACSDARYTNLYGGCNQANIYGNVILNLCGGTYTNVYGGSKGVAGGISADILDYTSEYLADHPELHAGDGGNVTLNLYGGTITNVYGGSNINGNIEGKITVNVLDDEGDCPLYVTNIYGGSNLTDYEPTDVTLVSPVVNLVHAKYGISGNVYGGSKGNVNATPPTKVTANPLVNIGYDASSMSITFPSDYPATNTLTNFPRAIVAGSVFGGGDAAKVVGNTAIFLRNRAKVFGNVYGGGNMGEVSGNTKVIVNGQNQ